MKKINENERKELFEVFLKDKNNFEIRNELIMLHQTLIQKIAKEFSHLPRMLERADLIQEGNLGLMKALEKYIKHNKESFINYAYSFIRKAIEDMILDSYPVSIKKEKDRLRKEETKKKLKI